MEEVKAVGNRLFVSGLKRRSGNHEISIDEY